MKRYVCFTLVFFSFIISGEIQAQGVFSNKLAHTYSIVARDPDTGEMGVAVQSHWFAVGSLVAWAEAGVGAIATQSFVNVSFGPNGLKLLKEGKSAQEVLDEMIKADEGRDVRQLAIIDAKGNVAAFTGEKCIPEAGHYVGENFSVQANLMLSDGVWSAMSKAFREAEGPLAERMVAALEAAQKEGGDIRGKQSAALLVVKGVSSGKVWEDRLIDLRIEDHETPILEIKRLLKVHRAYEYMNKGDVAMEINDVEGALEAYGTAEELYPDNIEIQYWHAIALANAKMVDRSLPMFKKIFEADENWLILTKRLPATGLLNVTDEEFQKIITQKE
ncbi:DUF1028 domain-containing protein [candidate division KSB1 bacterium]|nr:DUF1028 domain-containing protein [candidate division KSB1 bacterium]